MMSCSELILFASFGEGHKKAATGLAETLSAPVYDILEFVHPLIRKAYWWGYASVTQKTPLLWSLIFNVTKARCVSFALHRLQSLLFLKLIVLLRQVRPRIIIFTHFSPSKIIAPFKHILGSWFVCVITDIRVHPLWVDSSID